MRTTRNPGILLLIFIVLVAVGGAFTVRALTRPASGAQASYSALFTNASGLRPGDDVRLLGVQVGKVESVALEQGDGARATLARVGFTLDREQRLTGKSTLSIRFQNLTGLRYLDVTSSDAKAAAIEPGATIGTERTVPSFDVTSIFNGLQPVLAAMQPDQINHLAQSIAAVVEGDGSGLGPLMNALETLARFTNDRSALLETLVRNLSAMNETLGGKSTTLPTVIGYLTSIGQVLRNAAPSTKILSDQGAELMAAADALLRGAGLQPAGATWLELARPELPRLQSLVDLAALLPGLFASLTQQRTPAGGGATGCSRGEASLPAGIQVFLRGTKVTLCRN
ncbi:MlaD family protein [Tsukamurella sp. PLM1]|uniref:MlaD family protein n=1 Tax=Tsukamurella sp. PLM1 TaxID=2929795 RepID=UPI00204FB774|nr:MlaD family protein [Tsukamurella sp. PLM1]BDH59781.1 putative Mce family protein [Tsukamurella sp. PLM1]